MGVPLKTENEENPGKRMQIPGSLRRAIAAVATVRKGGRRVFRGTSKADPAWTDTEKSPPASPVA
jgi:hypothetical protein